MVMTQTFVEFATATGPNIFACFATCLVIDIGVYPVIYSEDLTVGIIGEKVLNAFFVFIILTLIGMLVTYISLTR